MKQIEVRLAVVLYGGVSLAVYIHGVTREILNLVRASKLFRAAQSRAISDSDLDAQRPADDSTAIYYDLFRALSPAIELRVVVDLISGASAGGINGVMLARALAHDLPLEPHRDLWLKNADVTSLSAPGNWLGRLGKAPLAPLIDRFVTSRFGRQVADPETRSKLRQFIQAQWFTPPFSGERFSGWMLDACDRMEDNVAADGCLLPPCHRLDLFVTLTDYRGHRHRIELHDPPSVDETEHRRIVCFTCRRGLSGEMVSEFTNGDVPSLVFSARATASFPGAFPPATIAEMDRVLAARGRSWPSRQRLVNDKLLLADAAGSGYFIDGSVVMNKPFSPVIHALGNRPASREVVRRIIYVDPNPQREAGARGDGGTPGFFRTILTALAAIPRNEPIADDLLAIQEWNGRARRMAEILTAADPQVERLVDAIIANDPDNPPTIAEVGRYRSEANTKAHAGAGYAYLSYQTLKLRRLVDRLAELIAAIAATHGGESELKPDASAIGRLLDRWAAQQDGDGANRLVPFLRGFDVDFRMRRVRFVIRRLNELYRSAGEGGETVQSRAIDDLKAALYEVVDRLARLWDASSYHVKDGNTVSLAAATIARNAAAGEAAMPDSLAQLEAAMGLVQIDKDLDEIISLMGLAYLHPTARRAVAMSYVGFAFYDLITFPILQWTDMDEINEVLVDRISPADARGIGAGKIVLKGTSLMNFGAFFNRAWREHDYLWGRLNAADRCVDVLMSAIGAHNPAAIDADRLRRNLFHAILESEAPHLLADAGLIPGLRRQLAGEDGPSP
jgi:patatin-related protein